MLLARLALKNLGRNRRRSAMTAAAIIAGIGAFVLGQAFVDGTCESIVVAAENGLVGHLYARPKGYPSQGFQYPVDELLELTPDMRAFLDREAVAWTERQLFSPLASNGRDAVRVRAIGYDPERDEKVFPRSLWKVNGALPGAQEDAVALGRGAARLLSAKPGDRLVLQVRTHRGAINALEVRVGAVVTTNNQALDGMGILVPAPLAHKLIAAKQPSHVAVRLARRELAPAFAPKLVAALGGGVEAVTWDDETRELLRLQELRRKALDFVVAILLALAGFAMANTILMAAHERTREVGTLRSMGMTEGGVVGLFMLEGGFLGLVASALGAGWGGALAAHWAKVPLDFSEALSQRTSGDLPISTLIYTRFEPRVLALSVAFGVAVAVLASVYPALVASRMIPADAVRAE